MGARHLIGVQHPEKTYNLCLRPLRLLGWCECVLLATHYFTSGILNQVPFKPEWHKRRSARYSAVTRELRNFTNSELWVCHRHPSSLDCHKSFRFTNYASHTYTAHRPQKIRSPARYTTELISSCASFPGSCSLQGPKLRSGNKCHRIFWGLPPVDLFYHEVNIYCYCMFVIWPIFFRG